MTINEALTASWNCRPKPTMKSMFVLSFIARLSLLDMHKAEILHQRPVVMDQEPSRTIARVEMLMPAKYGNAQNISLAPVVAAIFDETVSTAGDDVVHLFVHMPMGPRA